MSDIFSITYEESIANGVCVEIGKNCFEHIMKFIRCFCKEGYAFAGKGRNFQYAYVERIPNDKKEFLFKIDDFNEITDEQFLILRKRFNGFGAQKLQILKNIQSYFLGKPFEKVSEKIKISEYEERINLLHDRIKKLTEENKKLREEKSILVSKMKQYDRNAERIEKFKKETLDFLSKI